MRRVLTIAGIAAAALLAAAGPALGQQTEPAPPTAAPGVPSAGAPSAGQDTTAAALHGWGEPSRVEEFDGAALGDAWDVYDGPGHVGNGRRTPEAVSLRDGVMTITGSPDGDTAGMAWKPGQKYGRWEGRVKVPAGDETYNALMLLWPSAENWPVGGELDFMEMTDHTRQTTQLFLHYGKDNKQIQGEVEIDGTQWHNWAVEWTPTHVAAFVDGREWWRTSDTEKLPPGPMHLCIQLDWFPDSRKGEVQESSMMVDWVKQYTLDAAAPASPAAPSESAAPTEPGAPALPEAPAAATAPAVPAGDPATTGTATQPTAVHEALDRATQRVEAAAHAVSDARRRAEIAVAQQPAPPAPAA